MKRELKAAIGATALLAGAASVVVIGGATSGTAAGVPSSAYGLSASGLIPIDPPLAYAVSPDGSEQTASVADVPVPGLLDAGVITSKAANDAASSSVASIDLQAGLLDNLGLADALGQVLDPVNQLCTQVAQVADGTLGQLSDTVTGTLDQLGGALATVTSNDLVQDTVLGLQLQDVCDKVASLTDGSLLKIGPVTASCQGHTGTTDLAPATILGIPVSLPTGTNQSLSGSDLITALGPVGDLVSQILDLKVNTQTENADGTFTVTALTVSVLGQIELKVASATCGHVTADKPTEGPTAPPAPAPKPIKTDVPVTG